MTDDAFYRPNPPPARRRQPKPGEPIWSLRYEHVTWSCELRFHGEFGVEAQILREGVSDAGACGAVGRERAEGDRERRRVMPMDDELRKVGEEPLMTIPGAITDDEVTEAMMRLGGSFVAGLGSLFRRADPVNQAVLKAAFPQYWKDYTALAARWHHPDFLDRHA